MSTNFQIAYNQLNSNQRLAVDTIDGPVMVIAGPGTGKTQVLSTRIANILQKTDTPPDAILALTFTESAAKNMRQRLISIIGETAYYLHISTFHAFCTDIIRTNPDQFLVSIEAEPLSDLEKIQIIQTILDQHPFAKLKPVNAPYFYTKTILKCLSDLKREGILPENFAKIVKTCHQPAGEAGSISQDKNLTKTEFTTQEKNLAKNEELLKIYELYQKEILKRHRFDFEDMINLVMEKFQSEEDFLRSYQERFQYFLVDEYQDTNSAQNAILYELASFWGEEANLFVVGDPHQSIYRFQGASFENILDFQKHFPKATLINLTDNYRSNQTILDASFALIQKNLRKEQKNLFLTTEKLKSLKSVPEEKISVLSFPSETVEEYFIVDQIKKLIKSGVSPEEIAILYRHNADSGNLSDLLSKEKITYNLEGGIDILIDPTINKLLKLLQLIVKSKNQTDDLELFTILHYEFFHFDPLDILKLSRQASAEKKHLIEVIDSSRDAINRVSTSDKFTCFLTQITHWQHLDATLTFSQFFEVVLQESGFLDWILMQNDRVEKLNRLHSLFATIKSLNRSDHRLNLTVFLRNVALMIQNNLKITEEDLDLTKDAITLSTVHKAKGKEWQYVFMMKTIDGKWGNNSKRELLKLPPGILKNTDLSQIETNEEERRLFYVAVTRAKQKIFVTYSESTNQNQRRIENLPSLFLAEIPHQYLQNKGSFDFNSETVMKKMLQSQTISPDVFLQKEMDFLQKIIRDFKLSPTALETYLTCPYKFKLNNLIKVPRAKQPYLCFGTAVHRALELFYQQFQKTQSLPEKNYLIQEFGKALEKEVLTDTEQQSQLQRGQKALGVYYDYYQNDFGPTLYTEKFFGYGNSQTYLEDIPLTGKIDRIDFVETAKKTVRVVDYKTGKPKSRNFIEGKTLDSNGAYKRQLIFYKLLTQLDHNFPLIVTETQLDFIEPDNYNKLKKENFTIVEEEVTELKKTIRQVMRQIRNLHFERTTEYKSCVQCEFKDHCWPEGIPKESVKVKSQSAKP